MNISAKNAARATATERDARWAAVVARAPQTDGTFYYSVKTTGVYCRPSCAARLPRPEHVRFHATCKEAELAGFRPCKRCRPDEASPVEQHAARIAQTCRLIEESEEAPSLRTTGTPCGIEHVSLPPPVQGHHRADTKSIRGGTSGQAGGSLLDRSSTVTEAIYDAGYRSNGRFYETSHAVLGMTPSHYRAGGTGTDIRFAVGECSLGSILVATSARGVCAILLGDDPDELTHDLQDRFPRANVIGGNADFEQLVAKVVGFVEAPTRGLDLPLDVRGTAFQQRVWQALQNIPAGSTATYTDIAKQIGSPKSVRAVAQACGANALAVAIPCHRVVRTDGALSGYRWGVERKRALLNGRDGHESHGVAHRLDHTHCGARPSDQVAARVPGSRHTG